MATQRSRSSSCSTSAGTRTGGLGEDRPRHQTGCSEQKMQGDWWRWMGDHAKMIALTEAAGKTKAVTSSGVGDIKNDITPYFDRGGGEPRYQPQRRLPITRT